MIMDKETARYIINYYGGLFTEHEAKAYTHLISTSKLTHSSSKKSMKKLFLEKGFLSEDPKVLELLKDGNDVFFENTALRIISDHPETVFLNNCQQCGKLARTPKARQCRHCGHKWFH